MSSFRRPSHGVIVIGAFAALGLVAVMAKPGPTAPTLALINETDSVPRGLYVRSADSEPRLGRLVMIAQPESARAYLAGLGVPAELHLLKRVAAVGGQGACACADVLRISERVVPIRPTDRRGVTLPVWRECRALAEDELLLLGDSSLSFDGRYFGPVSKSAVEAVYSEVLLW